MQPNWVIHNGYDSDLSYQPMVHRLDRQCTKANHESVDKWAVKSFSSTHAHMDTGNDSHNGSLYASYCGQIYLHTNLVLNCNLHQIYH